jgi:pilus assembly protein Flp/PilA
LSGRRPDEITAEGPEWRFGSFAAEWAAESSPVVSRGRIPMREMLAGLRQFLVAEDGPTAVEYAVMLALILVACITIVTTLGTTVSGTFSKVNSTLSS